MKKLFTAFFLFSLISFTTFSQSFEIGTGIHLIRFRGADVSFPGTFPIVESRFVFNALFSGNIPFHIREELAFGISPNFSFGALQNTLAINVPVLLTARYGAGSSREAMNNWGVGGGIGAMYNYVNTWINFASPVLYSFGQFTPIIMGEFSFAPRGRLMRIRGEFTPLPLYRSDNTFEGEISQFTILFMRTF
ncbi:MAG: hypothetical protein ACK4ND_03250 [Cytophagaceae bacterium]